jgi:hypothetical protein
MKGKVAMTIAIILIVIAGGLTFNCEMNIRALSGKSPLNILNAGSVIVINSLDKEMVGGAAIPTKYYGITYNLDLKGNFILSGTWSSTNKSIVWLMNDNVTYMELPTPRETHGVLNQTIFAGYYTLIIGGYIGDRILITSSIKTSYNPFKVGSFKIPAGSYFYDYNGTSSFSLNLSEPAILVGSLYAKSNYGISLTSDNGQRFSTSASGPYLIKFGLNNGIYYPGSYDLSFWGTVFYVNQTLEFIYYYDNSS